MRIFAAIICLLLCMMVPAYAQVYKKGVEYKYNLNEVILAKQIIWYGIDFSHAKITYPTNLDLDRSKEGKPSVPKFLALFNERYDAKWFYKRLKPKKIISDPSSIQNEWQYIDDNEFITPYSYEFPVDSISRYLKKYNLLQTNGVGLVLIMESLHKKEKYVLGHFAFFNIETRELLYTTRMKGKPGRPGGATSFVDWWETGFDELFIYYVENYLKPILKH